MRRDRSSAVLVGVVVTAFLVIGLGACGASKSSHVKIAAHRVKTGTFGSAPQDQSAESAPAYHPTGRIIADDGFRPDPNGFSFPNYGSDAGSRELTPAALEDLFGPDVCASGVGNCLLTPPADAALQQLNSFFKGGHCYGFSVAALRFFKHVLDPTIFGAPTVSNLNIQGNDLLQIEIAEAFVTQVFPSVVRARIVEPPNQILSRLIAALKARQEVYSVVIAKDSTGAGGHAITPYAVEDRGGGKFAVLVYDNNYPLITRAVSFDRNRNTWTYNAAANPRNRSERYAGDAHSLTIALDPLRPGLGQQPCFFCRASNAVGAASGQSSVRPKGAYQQIALEGDPSNHSHLVITDPQGRRTGFVNGKLVAEIPGSRAITPYADQNWRLRSEPIYQLPAGVQVTVSLDGTSLAKPSVENVSLVASGASAVVKGVKVAPGEKANLAFGNNASSVQYRSGNVVAAAPMVQLGRQAKGADFQASVKAPVLKRGSTLKVSLNPKSKQLTVKTPPGTPRTGYGLALARLVQLGKQEFNHSGLTLPADSKARLKFARFTHSGQNLPLTIKHGSASRTTSLSG